MAAVDTDTPSDKQNAVVLKVCKACKVARPLVHFRKRGMFKRGAKRGEPYILNECKFCDAEKARLAWRKARKLEPCPCCGHLRSIEKGKAQ